jgi:two-component system, OmpR family, phosphate regulon response regulator PhoB
MPTDESICRRILIAERDRNVRDLQSYVLETAGFVVEFADDGEAALARATSHAPALVVTEILIPKLDGLTLCRRLREDHATRDVPVLVFSILAAAARAEEAGASAFLRKPFIESSFIATVSMLATAHQPAMMGTR